MQKKNLNNLKAQYISITKIAVISRVLIIILQFISNILIKDHEAEDVFLAPKNLTETRSLDWIIDTTLGGFRRWDAQYFLHIAEHGYTYENNIAFFPLFPFIVKIITTVLHPILFGFSFRALALLVAIVLNVYLFNRAANALYGLSRAICEDKNKSKISVILFCMNPASIFFTAPYSESLYAAISFIAMERCRDIWINCKGITVSIAVHLTLSIACRSNGFINIGFLLYESTFNIFKDKFKTLKSMILKLTMILLCILFYFGMHQAYNYRHFCFQRNFKIPQFVKDYGIEKNFIIAGNKTDSTSPWCHNKIPMAYSYVQNNYWDVGFLNYYKLRQIPNFLLATPAILITLIYSYKYFKRNMNYCLRLGIFMSSNLLHSNPNVKQVDRNMFPYVVHITFLAFFCIFFVHIQVSTRLLLSSSPMIYWICADFFPSKRDKYGLDYINLHLIKSMFKSQSGKLIIFWCIIYSVIGTILFSNFLPWT